jgi:hypothetical protein
MTTYRKFAACLFLLGFTVTLMAEPQPHVVISEQTSDAKGLKMLIAPTKAQYKNQPPAFRITLINSGEKDLMVNVGMMLGNGKVLHPTAIGLCLIDSDGKSKELLFPMPSIAGRVDDYIIPIRIGSTHTLTVSLTEFWDPKGAGLNFILKPGTYEIYAQLDSRGIRHVNSGTEGLVLMNIWKGILRSEIITFTIK